MGKVIAIYLRVSSEGQDFASQLPDLKAWAENQSDQIVWYKDKASGASMKRPGMDRLMDDIVAGKIGTVACWRLDRLGRNARGLVTLFDDLIKRKINLVSLKDDLYLSTSNGRFMANILTSVAVFESEVRRERQMAGIAAAKAAGRTWGGSVKGRHYKGTEDHIETVGNMKATGKKISVIARMTGLSRPTIYKILEKNN